MQKIRIKKAKTRQEAQFAINFGGSKAQNGFNYGSSVDYFNYANQAQQQPQLIPYTQQQYNQQNNIQPFNYGSSQDYLGYANNPQAYDIGMNQSSVGDMSGTEGSGYGAAAQGITTAAYLAGDIMRGINNVKNSIISGGGALLNGLLQDQHNERQRSPQLVDQTFAYQPQYNNMYDNGGNLQPANGTPSAYLPGTEVDLSPEEVAQLKAAGYQFEII